MITTRGLQELSGLPSPVCSNYYHGRFNYVSKDKQEIIDSICKMSHTQLIDEYLSRGKTLTMAQALTLFGIGALSQRVGELNRQLEKRGEKRRVINMNADKGGPGVFAEYKLQVTE